MNVKLRRRMLEMGIAPRPHSASRDKPLRDDSPQEKTARLRRVVESLEKRLEDARQRLAEAEGVQISGWTRGACQPPAPPQDPDEDGEAIDGVWRQVHWTWKERILQVIQDRRSPMLAKEVVPALLAAFPKCAWASDTANTVSVVLSKMVKSGAVVRIVRPGQSGAAYGLPGCDQVYINPKIDKHG